MLVRGGRQPSPDSEVVEIAAGSETKDDFVPVPPDEGRGFQRSFLMLTVHGLHSQLCTMADQKIKSVVVRRIKPDFQQDIMGGAPMA